MKKETLSSKRDQVIGGLWVYPEEDVKEKLKDFVEELKSEHDDFKKDIIALIEINHFGKEDLIAKMKRLCKEHKKEIDKVFDKHLGGDLK